MSVPEFHVKYRLSKIHLYFMSLFISEFMTVLLSPCLFKSASTTLCTTQA